MSSVTSDSTITGTGTYIMKIKSNTTNEDLPLRFGLYQRPSSEPHVRQISCHVTSLPWQEPEEELVSFSSDEGL